MSVVSISGEGFQFRIVCRHINKKVSWAGQPQNPEFWVSDPDLPLSEEIPLTQSHYRLLLLTVGLNDVKGFQPK